MVRIKPDDTPNPQNEEVFSLEHLHEYDHDCPNKIFRETNLFNLELFPFICLVKYRLKPLTDRPP